MFRLCLSYKDPDACIRMRIVIDGRETSLINQVKELDSEIVVRNMVLGDAAIIDEHDGVQLYVERKTLCDLSASIGDGRYKEQSARLGDVQLDRKRIFYVIEGDVDKYESARTKHRLPYSTLVSAMFSLAVDKGFSIHHTKNVAETAKWLLQIREKVRKMSKVQQTAGGPRQSPVGISDAPTRASSITKENIELRMICQLPGVSEKTGRAILARSGTLSTFIAMLSSDTECAELKTVRTSMANGKLRRIPAKCIDTAKELLV